VASSTSEKFDHSSRLLIFTPPT